MIVGKFYAQAWRNEQRDLGVYLDPDRAKAFCGMEGSKVKAVEMKLKEEFKRVIKAYLSPET